MRHYGSVFDDAGKRRKLSELEQRSRAEDFWGEPQQAQQVMKQLSELREETEEFARVQTLLDEAEETLDVLGEEAGAEDDAERAIEQAAARLDELEMAANFDREY
ncbi:MAG: PCRF domain-containing protein, partial [Candidatus Eremiobacteraeota bacterium]|nr:PCRF domain-containing protein [Candidatus Eremiobacteraeota bacterium]